MLATVPRLDRTIIEILPSNSPPVAWRPQSTVHEHNRSQSVAAEGCVLARLIAPNDTFTENPLDELTGLAESAGTHVVAGVLQRREKPDPKTYLGKGKIEELRSLVEMHSADVVIFDNDLSPGQTRNIEKEVGTKVIDRTEYLGYLCFQRANS